MNISASYRLAVLLPTLLLCAAAQAQTTQTRSLAELGDNPIIRVLLVDSVTSMCVIPKALAGATGAKSDWQVKTLSGKRIDTLKADELTTIVLSAEVLKLVTTHTAAVTINFAAEPIVLEPPADDAIIRINKVPFGVGWWWAGSEDRSYIGKIEIHPTGGKLVVVCVLPLESYMRGVVPSEIGADSPLQALSAQAVAARSAAVLALTSSIYSGSHHDICSDVACQAFSGMTKSNAATDEAVTSTRGLVLSFQGKPVSAYYASNCGGHTDIRNVWPDRAHDRAYWDAATFDGPGTGTLDLTTEDGIAKWQTADPDCFCNPTKYQVPKWATKYWRWKQETSAEELTKRVALKKDVGRVTTIRAIKRGHSGRIIEAEFIGENGSLRVGPELAIRQIWDPPLKSSAFVVENSGPAGKPDKFIINGAGWGHGVGMCQTGAVGMANKGFGFRQILNHYYPNASIESVY